MSFMEKSTKSGFHPIDSLVTIIFGLIILILLVLTGIEMFMARIEFWTLAMATIPLVPFAALPQTRFLFQSALSGMMNLAIKVSVIAFISAISTGILTDYVQAFTKPPSGTSIAGNISLFIQALLVSLLLYLLVKKIPQLVSSLLSGRPELSGASMTQMAKSAVQTGAKVGTAVATGGAGMVKAGVAGAKTGGFKAAGMASALGGGAGTQMAAGTFGAIGGAMNAAGGSLLSGGAGLAKQALLGATGGGGGSSGGAGGAGGGGGLLAPFQRGAQLGNFFNSQNKDGSYKTVTGMTGMDKAVDGVASARKSVKQAGGFDNLAKQKVKSMGNAVAKTLDNIDKNGGPLNTMKKTLSNKVQNSDAYTTGFVKMDDFKKGK